MPKNPLPNLNVFAAYAKEYRIGVLHAVVIPGAMEALAVKAGMTTNKFTRECLKNKELGDYVREVIMDVDVAEALGPEHPFVKKFG